MSILYDIFCAYVHALTSYISHLWLMLSIYGYCDISGYRSTAKF